MGRSLSGLPRPGRTSRAAYAAALLVVAACLGALHTGRASGSATRSTETAAEESFSAAINDVRASYGLAHLAIDPRLTAAGRSHSADMVAHDVFEHGTFWKRDEAHGVTTGRVGETLGWTAPASGALQAIVSAWLKSPEHRAILLDPAYRAVGVGIARGRFLGHPDALVVTADFHAP